MLESAAPSGEREGRRAGAQGRVQAAAAEHAAACAIAVGVAAVVAVAARADGAYYVDVWGPLGLLLLLAGAALLVARRAPALLPASAAGALALLGGWAVLSTRWGGLPNAAWTMLDQSLVAALGLVVASALATTRAGRGAVLAGVLAGLAVHAIEVLVRVGFTGAPASWFYQRYLEGPVGYHNAQATLFAVGLPLALALATSRAWYVRAGAGAATAVLLGPLILTQSRGGLLAAGLGLLVALAWARDLHIALLTLPVLAAATGLLVAVRDVDAALVEHGPAGSADALRTYVVWVALAAAALAAVAVVSPRSDAGRRVAVAAACLTIAAGAAGALEARASLERALDRITGSLSETDPDSAPAGSTRLASLSPNGRRQAWSVAWEMTRQHPVRGAGQGQFSRRWGTERDIASLYVLQPHSLELELLAELGAVGLALFVAFAAAGAAGAARGPRRTAAVALGAGAALFGEVSVDWTWSFPGVVLPALLLVGAAGGGRRLTRPLPVWLAAAPVALGGLVVLAAPALADRQLDRARLLATSDPDRAWRLALDAHRLDPWDERTLVLQARLATTSKLYRLAAEKYDRAASLSRQPWVRYFQEADVLRRAGASRDRARACRLAAAANPLEPLLREGPCKAIG